MEPKQENQKGVRVTHIPVDWTSLTSWTSRAYPPTTQGMFILRSQITWGKKTLIDAILQRQVQSLKPNWWKSRKRQFKRSRSTKSNEAQRRWRSSPETLITDIRWASSTKRKSKRIEESASVVVPSRVKEPRHGIPRMFPVEPKKHSAKRTART